MGKFKSKNGETLEMLVQFFIVFSALSYNIELINKAILFIIGVLLLGLLAFKRILFNQVFTIYKIDLWWLFFIAMFIFNRDPNYAKFASYFLILGLISMFVFREDSDSYRGAFIAIFIFTTLNLFANILSILSYNSFRVVTNFLRIATFADTFSNLTGLFSDIGRNAYASIVGFSISFALLLARYKKYNILLWLFSILMFIMVIATGKLAHTIFLLASIIFVLMFLEKSTNQRLKKLFALFVIIFSFFAFSYIFIPQTVLVIDRTLAKISYGDLSSGRLNLWRISFNLFIQNPIWGIGYGGFTVNSLNYTDIAIYAGVHNDYLQWLTESGITGFLVNIAILVSVYTLSLRIFKIIESQYPNYSFNKALILWSIFFQTFVILYSFTGIPHFSYEINTLYLISCGVPFALMKQLGNKTMEKNVVLKIRTSNGK